MRIGGLLAALLVVAPAAAQDDRHVVAPGNTWSITDSDCSIDAGWDDEVAVLVTRHDDHHDLGVYDPRFKALADGKVAKVQLGTGGQPADAQDYDAAMNTGGGSRSYVVAVDDAKLDALAASGALQLFRGRKTLVDLNISGFDGALAAMRECERARPSPHDAAAEALEVAAEADISPPN